MTLNTRIYVHQPVDVKRLFHEGQRLLHIADLDAGADRRTPERMVWTDEPDKVYRDGGYVDAGTGVRRIANEIDQGLPAILDVTYRDGGPLRTPEQVAEHDEDICTLPGSSWWVEGESEPCDGTGHPPACYAEISLDTAYGYQTTIGGCGDLHAALVAAFGVWLTSQGSTFSWMNEFTGDIYQGTDGLDTLGENGAEAQAWFRNVAMPAIEASIGVPIED